MDLQAVLGYHTHNDHISAKKGFKMNIALVDDSEKERKNVARILNEYALSNQLSIEISEFSNAADFVKDYIPYYYAFIFLDIYMDEMDGIEAAKNIRLSDPEATIIFLTSSDEHMPEAFSVHAYDYIGKPAHRDRIFKLFDELMERKTAISNEPTFSFICDKNQIVLPYSGIVLIQTSSANYLDVMDSRGNTYRTRMTFSSICDELSKDNRFLLLIRGSLVNMDHIVNIETSICLLDTGISIPVNVRKSDSLTEIWRNYKFKKIRTERRERRMRK